jgi:hypothetical protein
LVLSLSLYIYIYIGRTQPGATDVIQTLQDLVPSPVEMKDLIKIFETPQRPFPRGIFNTHLSLSLFPLLMYILNIDVPLFPVRKRGVSGNTIESTKLGHREELPAYAPSFLPPLPNLHTYSSDSKTVVEREQDTKRVRLDLLGQKNQVQQSLHGLQQASFTTSKCFIFKIYHTTMKLRLLLPIYRKTNGTLASSSSSSSIFMAKWTM